MYACVFVFEGSKVERLWMIVDLDKVGPLVSPVGVSLGFACLLPTRRHNLAGVYLKSAARKSHLLLLTIAQGHLLQLLAINHGKGIRTMHTFVFFRATKTSLHERAQSDSL